jgi:O-antigen biosynthesis protein WbqP
LKRAFDIGASSVGLIVLSPIMAIIWAAVKATSPGPALHTSMRIGRFGRAFRMPKFRTMYVDSPSCARETLGKADQRITPLGRVLRRTGLDELPQLVSVLRGQMSLIGPRPLLANDPGASERAKFPDALDVRPGISGLAQVSGRNLVSPRRKARLDAFYARKPSLRFDLVLLLRTIFVIVTGKGFL